jgi:hypothetical protein
MSEETPIVGSCGSGVGETQGSHTAPTPDTTNWPLLYSAVLIELAVLILIFYAFTKAFA